MCSESPSRYEQWRRVHGRPAALKETPDGHPPERLLQAVWARQRLQRDQLQTADGRAVRVLHPGFWNREAGPDFQGAVLQFEAEAAVTGDVEVDLRSEGWRAHGHDRNPAFQNVVLHVVWNTPQTAVPDCPTLVLRDRLDAPLAELGELLDGELPPPLAGELQGRCGAPLKALDAAGLKQLLDEAARIRLHSRAGQLRARARRVGWEQALIEGLLRGLGYKHNAWPMQRLGELCPRLREALADGRRPGSPQQWQALLLGTSGLLPTEVKGSAAAANKYLRGVWDLWWRERDRLSSFVLPHSLWRLAGIRPANHPQRRLALAAHWLADPTFFRRLEQWFAALAKQLATGVRPSGAGAWVRGLSRELDPGPDPFWSRRWTLRARTMAKAQPLLGPARTTDLAVNVILPWFFVRAREGRNHHWSAAAERAWSMWPAAEDNAVLRLARARLLGNACRNVLRSAADQQGVLQIVRDFCDHSNAICKQCRFPQLVTNWPGQEATD